MATQWTSDEIELLTKSESRKDFLANYRKQFGDKRTDAAVNFAWDTREDRKAKTHKKKHKESTAKNYKMAFKSLSDESKELISQSKNKDDYIRRFFAMHPKTHASTAKLSLEYFAYKDHQRQLRTIAEANIQTKTITKEPVVKTTADMPDVGETMVKVYNEFLLTNQLLRELIALTEKQLKIQESVTSKLVLPVNTNTLPIPPLQIQSI